MLKLYSKNKLLNLNLSNLANYSKNFCARLNATSFKFAVLNSKLRDIFMIAHYNFFRAIIKLYEFSKTTFSFFLTGCIKDGKYFKFNRYLMRSLLLIKKCRKYLKKAKPRSADRINFFRTTAPIISKFNLFTNKVDILVTKYYKLAKKRRGVSKYHYRQLWADKKLTTLTS